MFRFLKPAQQGDDADVFETVAAQVVDVIASAGMLIDERGNVLRASPGAERFGLVLNARLVHAELANLADQARKSEQVVQIDTELAGTNRREKFWLHARAARFGEGFVMLLVDDRLSRSK